MGTLRNIFWRKKLYFWCLEGKCDRIRYLLKYFEIKRGEQVTLELRVDQQFLYTIFFCSSTISNSNGLQCSLDNLDLSFPKASQTSWRWSRSKGSEWSEYNSNISETGEKQTIWVGLTRLGDVCVAVRYSDLFTTQTSWRRLSCTQTLQTFYFSIVSKMFEIGFKFLYDQKHQSQQYGYVKGSN